MKKVKSISLLYENDRDAFLEKLKEFHIARGNTFGRTPTFGGKTLDLYALYNTVTSLGGVENVTKKRKWGQVFTTLGFPPCTNADFALKKHYNRYLEMYERIFFFGEDVDERLYANKHSYNQPFKHRRLNRNPREEVLGELRAHNFDRVLLSLQSGLQNEVDFALNICALLSNVTNSIFNLAKSAGILDLILAHGGIWGDSPQDEELFLQWYSKSEKDFQKFWLDSIDEPYVKAMFKQFYCADNIDEKTSKLFAPNRIKEKSPESARINQICLILHNFSFERINAMYLAQHTTAKRFLLFGSCCHDFNIKKMCLDTLDNIAEHVTLHGNEDNFTQHIFQLIHQYISSQDRLHCVRARSILAKLAHKENSVIMAENLSFSVYKTLISTLSLPDISLLLTSLDSLFSLSSLCEETSNKISTVHNSINILVSLMTVRAESFGNQAIEGFRIVENKDSMFTAKNQALLKQQADKQLLMEQQQADRMMYGPTPSKQKRGSQRSHSSSSQSSATPSLPPQHPPAMHPPTEDLVELDVEIFSIHWMSAFYKPVASSKVLLSAIYTDYHSVCTGLGRNTILNPKQFEIVLRAIIPPDLAQIVPDETNKKVLVVSGVQRRPTPTHVQNYIPKFKHDALLANKRPIPGVKEAASRSKSRSKSTPSQIKSTPTQAKSTLTEQKNLAFGGSAELLEKLKVESQAHFMQFHLHRQYLQALQMQIHQVMQGEQAPPNVIQDIQMRAQTHQTQMQIHFQKIQQLSALSDEVQKNAKTPVAMSETNKQTDSTLHSEPMVETNNHQDKTSKTATSEQGDSTEGTEKTASDITRSAECKTNSSLPIGTLQLIQDSPAETETVDNTSNENKQVDNTTIESRQVDNPLSTYTAKIDNSANKNKIDNSNQDEAVDLKENRTETTVIDNSPSQIKELSSTEINGDSISENEKCDDSKNKNDDNSLRESKQSSSENEKIDNLSNGIESNGVNESKISDEKTSIQNDRKEPLEDQKQNGEHISKLDNFEKPSLNGVHVPEDLKRKIDKLVSQNEKVIRADFRTIEKSSHQNGIVTNGTHGPMNDEDIEKDLRELSHEINEPKKTENNKNNIAQLNGFSQNNVSENNKNSPLINGDRPVENGLPKPSLPALPIQFHPMFLAGGFSATPPLNTSPAGKTSKSRSRSKNTPSSRSKGGKSRSRSKKDKDNLINGMTPNGLTPNGFPLNGLSPNGFPPNGLLPNGLPLNGLPPNGFLPNGFPPNGLPPNSLPPNGFPATGYFPPGLFPPGLFPPAINSPSVNSPSSTTSFVEMVNQTRTSLNSMPAKNKPKQTTNNKDNDIDFKLSPVLPTVSVDNSSVEKTTVETTLHHESFTELLQSTFFTCPWEACNTPPLSSELVLFEHMLSTHCPRNGDSSACKVKGCSQHKMLRGEFILHTQRKHFSTFSSLTLEEESPVTRSVRFTAALILRNLARFSPSAKLKLVRYEEDLVRVSVSTSEASPAASQCLAQLYPCK